ncbi:flavin reductase [Mangrovicella endophytica]|uniref:flavin reductase n=1 Tax=Mangrovicella endophytica TaxID=2066697 RepID=UPI001FE20825|nr:flavin reductase [Mangrovicella endophytica]
MLKTSTIERTAFREAMSRFAAAVHLVTSDGPAGRRGVTVSAACSVSDDPATVLVCLNRSSALNVRFEQNGNFALNVLGESNESVARAFSGEGDLSPEERFASAEFITLETGAPVLADALVSLDCRLVETLIVATHRVMIGEVVALRMGKPDPALVYLDRGYHSL